MPWPTTPRWARRRAPMACPREHQATLAPHTQGPAPAHTPARARAYTQDDGIFRPPALRWGLVAVDSPLGLGTGQSGCSASWWGREGTPHPRACSCMRPPAQPNPTPPYLYTCDTGVYASPVSVASWPIFLHHRRTHAESARISEQETWMVQFVRTIGRHRQRRRSACTSRDPSATSPPPPSSAARSPTGTAGSRVVCLVIFLIFLGLCSPPTLPPLCAWGKFCTTALRSSALRDLLRRPLAAAVSSPPSHRRRGHVGSRNRTGAVMARGHGSTTGTAPTKRQHPRTQSHTVHHGYH